MTYQVTLCGSDGIVVASDRCEVWNEQSGRGRTTNKVKKLFLDSTRQLAWTFSGGHLSCVTAHYLRNTLEKLEESRSVDDVKAAIKDCAERACQAMPSLNRLSTDVLVLTVAQPRTILRVRIAAEPVIEEILSGKCVSGQTDSLVNFFPDHFYTKEMPVRELALLAAYCVRMAHDLDPKYVDGLDIAVYRDEKERFEFVEDAIYWEHALVLDAYLGECLKTSAIDIPELLIPESD